MIIRFIPKGTVNNNLGPSVQQVHLLLQTIIPLIAHDLCLEVLTMLDTEMRLFLGLGIPHSNTIIVAHISDIASVGTTLKVFSYYAVWAEHQTNAEQIRNVLCHGRGSNQS